jgi:hypothetical protein
MEDVVHLHKKDIRHLNITPKNILIFGILYCYCYDIVKRGNQEGTNHFKRFFCSWVISKQIWNIFSVNNVQLETNNSQLFEGHVGYFVICYCYLGFFFCYYYFSTILYQQHYCLLLFRLFLYFVITIFQQSSINNTIINNIVLFLQSSINNTVIVLLLFKLCCHTHYYGTKPKESISCVSWTTLLEV